MLEASQTMPSDSGFIYEETMMQIKSQPVEHAQLAKQVLLYLLLSKRPLSVLGLNEALAVGPHDTEINKPKMRNPIFLVSVCRGLVVVDNNIIRLAHPTLQDYLAISLCDGISAIQEEICLVCLTYLSFDAFQQGPCSDQESFKGRMQKHAFLEYAVRCLRAHLQDLSGRYIPSYLILRLANSKNALESYLQVWFSRANSRIDYYPRGTSNMHIIALLGCEPVMQQLLARDGVEVDFKDAGDRTPLSWAAENGNEAVVRLLLDNGANADSKDVGDRTPLSWAAENGNEAVVRLLLDNGANADSKDVGDRTPLSWAAEYGHEAAVKLLLGKGVDADSKDATHDSA
jgi:Ankyrin repeats (3 copies)/Ankyrin repeat